MKRWLWLAGLLIGLIGSPAFSQTTTTILGITEDTVPTSTDYTLTWNTEGANTRRVLLLNLPKSWGTTTFGAGSAYTWTFNSSTGTKPTLTFGDNAFTFSGSITVNQPITSTYTGESFLQLRRNSTIAPSNFRLYFEGSTDAGAVAKLSQNGVESTVSSLGWYEKSSIATLTCPEVQGGLIRVVGGVYITLPAVSACGTGAKVTVWAAPPAGGGGYSATRVYPNAADTLINPSTGLRLSAGVSLTSTGTSGNYMTFVAESSSGWAVLDSRGTISTP